MNPLSPSESLESKLGAKWKTYSILEREWQNLTQSRLGVGAVNQQMVDVGHLDIWPDYSGLFIWL